MTTSEKRFEIWPYAIIAAFVLFGAFVFGSVYIMISQKVELVSKDYYKEEIAFQQQIDRQNLTVREGRAIQLKVEGDVLRLHFPGSSTGSEGDLKFIRPSDAALDKDIHVRLDSVQGLVLPVSQFKSGAWILKANWNDKGKSFFDEQRFIIP